MPDLIDNILTAVELELQKQIARLKDMNALPFHDMLIYHMGWANKGDIFESSGKRIRPTILLLITSGICKDWLRAVPAAAAVELVHNFSLVHDDIQDNSEFRRNRLTLWKKWGMPMAINAGDALFVISFQALFELIPNFPAVTVLNAAKILSNTCLDLTRGQFLDMAYESRDFVTLDDYFLMINGKTAALLAACTQIGALLGQADEDTLDAYRLFGYHLGRAFQIQDDFLGIWGDDLETGKTAGLDLVEGKVTLPVIYGLSKQGRFADRWRAGNIKQSEAGDIAALLASEGAYTFTKNTSLEETRKSLNYLDLANPVGKAGDALHNLVDQLINRVR